MKGNRTRTSILHTPDDMNEVVRVTTPSVWLILLGALSLLAGLLVWGFFGTVTDEVNATGAIVNGRLVCYVPENLAGGLSPGMKVLFESGQIGEVLAVGEAPLSEAELSALLGNSPLRQHDTLSGWNRELTLYADGLSGGGPFLLSIVKEELRPVSFLLGDNR